MLDVPVVVSSSQGLHGQPGPGFLIAPPHPSNMPSLPVEAFPDEPMPVYVPSPEQKYVVPGNYWAGSPPPDALDIFMRSPQKQLTKYHSPPTKPPPAKRRLRL